MTAELVIEETGEVVEVMSRVEAERVTAQIADKLDTIADSFELVAPLIRDAITRQAWAALGYDSISAYVTERFKGALTRLPREIRAPFVRELSAAGMSTRAIAPVVGVNNATVHRDIAAVADATPDSPGLLPDATLSPEPQPVTGLDGKQYSRLDTQQPRRSPLPKQVSSAGWDLRKAVERLEKLVADDRFNTHKDEVAPHLRSHLTNAIEVCQDLLDRINLPKEI